MGGGGNKSKGDSGEKGGYQRKYNSEKKPSKIYAS
jgi:hypothetical protein